MLWQVQKTRVAVVMAYNQAPANMKASILKDCVIIHLHSVVPPDRVGVYAATPTARSLALRIPKCMPLVRSFASSAGTSV